MGFIVRVGYEVFLVFSGEQEKCEEWREKKFE